jgi:hypothetical protein
MRIEWQSGNGRYFMIDSLDPETLGRWLVETAGRAESGPAWSTVTVWPSYTPGGQADWVQSGTRVQINSPRELLKELAEQIERAEAGGVP